jgi:hypothetical protein
VEHQELVEHQVPRELMEEHHHSSITVPIRHLKVVYHRQVSYNGIM